MPGSEVKFLCRLFGGKLSYQEAEDLMYQTLAAIPDGEGNTLTMVPFAVESDHTNLMKRKIAKGIVLTFANAGFPMTVNAPQPKNNRSIRILCTSCGTTLFTVRTDHEGGAGVAAPALLTSLSTLRAECPHAAITAEDQRRFIEEAVAATLKDDE